jgi:hypothetical protein
MSSKDKGQRGYVPPTPPQTPPSSDYTQPGIGGGYVPPSPPTPPAQPPAPPKK